MVDPNYARNMRGTHGWAAATLAGLVLAANPAFAAPKRVVSTFLCTDEYVFRLLPRERIAALSFEATDRHPVVSTIADAARDIPAIRPSAEAVLGFAPDLVVMYEGTMPILHAQLAHAGVAVLDVPWGNSLADVRRITAMLGDKLGAPERARALLAEMDRKIPHASGAPVRTLIYEPNGYASSGGITAEIMRLSGLADVAPELRPTRTETLPIETVIVRAPQLLILSGDANAQNSRADMVQHHPALAAFHGYAAWAKLTPLLCPGPWSMDAAATFTQLGEKARGR
ncbi:MAG TPA: ABC transporter substrate-binding protein [Rhizomicrobium sp.]|nr:ABC transporter substrate-binding protein [Rhizomicrobium sp.]